MGALTLKPLENEVRQWELFENEGIDFTDSFALPVRLAGREDRVFFIEPCDPELPWITDRGRLFFEGAFHEADVSTEFVKKDTLLKSLLSLMFFFSHLNLRTSALSSNRCVIVFKRLSLENVFFINLFKAKFSFFNVKSESPFFTNTDFESSSQLTPSYMLKLKLSSAVILMGFNTRYESFVLNLALRQKKLKGRFEVFCLAPHFNLTVPSKPVGSSFKVFVSLVEGCHVACQELTKADLPMFFTNSSFFRNPSMSRLADMVSVVTLACSSMGGGGLSVVAESLETNAARYSAKFEQIETKDFETSRVVFHLNSDFSESPEIRAQINIGILGVSGHPALKVQAVIEQSDEKDKNRDLITVSTRGMLVNGPYLHLPTKNPFEEQTTHFNSEGLVKRSFIVANSNNSFFSDSYENLRKIYSVVSQVSFLFNSRDNDRVSNLLATPDNHKSYLWFMFMATASIVAMSARLNSDSTAFEESFLVKSNKFKQFGRSFRNFKVKYKFDDFFTGGSKDMLSTKSTTLMKCSKSVRLRTSNFF